MTDNSSLMSSRLRTDQYQYANQYHDGGLERARLLRGMALVGIGARLFFVYASANRISVSHTLLGRATANGQFDLTSVPGPPDPAELIASAHNADNLVNFALVASLIITVLFILAWISLARRKKRGDTLAAAVDSNRATRLASRLYVLIAIASSASKSVFTPGPNASPADRLHTLSHGDAANIGLQVAVITFLLIIALATSREISRALATGRIG